MSSRNPAGSAIYPQPCIAARRPYACPLKHNCQSFFFSPTLKKAQANRHVQICACKGKYTQTHTQKKIIHIQSHTHNSFHSSKLPSHSIWFVISFSALIISQYLGHSPLMVSRVLCSALLSRPDGWALRPQSEAPGERGGGEERGEGDLERAPDGVR